MGCIGFFGITLSAHGKSRTWTDVGVPVVGFKKYVPLTPELVETSTLLDFLLMHTKWPWIESNATSMVQRQYNFLFLPCNHYVDSQVQGLPRLRKALSHEYSPIYERTVHPERDITITTGATEGILSALMAFVEAGDEVIVMEPVFNLYACSGSTLFH